MLGLLGGLTGLLNPTRWLIDTLAAIALTVAFFSWREHEREAGRAQVRAEWDADTAARTRAALRASQAARAIEQALQTQTQKVANEY